MSALVSHSCGLSLSVRPSVRPSKVLLLLLLLLLYSLDRCNNIFFLRRPQRLFGLQDGNYWGSAKKFMMPSSGLKTRSSLRPLDGIDPSSIHSLYTD